MKEHLSHRLQLLPYALTTFSIIRKPMHKNQWHQLGVAWGCRIAETRRLLICGLSTYNWNGSCISILYDDMT